MTPALVILAALIGAAAVTAWWLRSTDLLIRRTERSKVVVELKSGETFTGLLAATDAKTITLRSASSLGPDGTRSVSIDGELLIPRGDVKFLQRP